MVNPWDPERVVSPDLARALIESTFPDFAPARVEPLGAGWDNTAYLLNDEVVFRFPRRTVALALFEAEARVLPRLAPQLPLPVPVPRWVEQPEERYPWPFAGYQFLPGMPATNVHMDVEARTNVARPLGEFLRALHAIPVTEARQWGAGEDRFRRFDLAWQREKITTRLEDLTARGVIERPDPWLRIIDEASAHPPTREVLVHGDLHSKHLLVDDELALMAVIDWGDVHCNHPATDLVMAWTFFPPAAREVFLGAYGATDDATLALARLRALRYVTEMEAYGRDRGNAEQVAEARRALQALT